MIFHDSSALKLEKNCRNFKNFAGGMVTPSFGCTFTQLLFEEKRIHFVNRSVAVGAL